MEWHTLDCELFGLLEQALCKERSVTEVEKHLVLGNAAFADERFIAARWHHKWFECV